MKITVLVGAAVAALVIASPLSAQTAGAFMTNPAFQDPAPRQCTSTVDMQHCAAHDLRVADAAMSARYSTLRQRLTPAERHWLLTEQRQWLKDRDSKCVAEADEYQGGSMAVLAVAQCWIDVTKDRERALAARL